MRDCTFRDSGSVQQHRSTLLTATCFRILFPSDNVRGSVSYRASNHSIYQWVRFPASITVQQTCTVIKTMHTPEVAEAHRQWGFCQQKRVVSQSSLSSDKLQGQTALSHHLFLYYIDFLIFFLLLTLFDLFMQLNSNNRIKLLLYLQSSENSSPNTYGRPPWLGASAIASPWSFNIALVRLGYVMLRCKM